MEKPINNRMNSETVLDQVIFQLTPTRTRYELFAVASNVTEKLASGLLKPFLLHLQAAEEQLAKGGYSIKLQPPAGLKSSWFTKGTAERFVSFVNSPHVLERSNNIEVELLQLEEAIRVQTGFRLQAEHHFSNEGSLSFMQGENISCSSGKSRVISKTRQEATKDQRLATSSKKQLLRALEARRVVLQKEQGMSIARATAAGFELLHLLQLAMFADCFGGPRLIEACCKFALLCRRAHVTGFCVEYFNMMDQDVSWALSNAVCVSILKSLEADSVSKQRNEENTELPKLLVADNHVQKNLCLSNAVCRNEQSLSRHSQQLPSFHKNPGPPGQGFEWSTSTDAHQAFSAMHTNGIGLCPMAYGYNYEYSLGCQENFTASDLFLSAASQQSNETQANFKTFSSADMNAFPALRKLQIVQNGIRNGSGNSFSNGYEKVSDGVSDSSPISSSCSGAPVKNALSRQASPTPGKYRNSCKKILAREVRKNVDSSELSNPKGSDFSELSDSEMRMQRFNNLLSDEGPVFLKEGKQVSQRTVLDDDSVMLFEQSRGFALGMRSKKCLDFKDPEACCEQTDAGFKVVDDPFLDHSLPVSVSHTQKMRISLDSELQISQIYDKMSKQALKVNSAICTNVRHDPDDLLMLPKQQNHYVSRNSCDLLNADVELRGPAGQKSATLSNRQKVGPEPSQERVKKFLDQYNEKKQAKLRGNTSGLRKLNREGTPRALKEDKKRTELVKSRRSDGASPQVEAQIRAEKLRMYKAELQKKKKEKEEEERCRLEGLRSQRQARIAARSNIVGSSSSLRGETKLHPVSSSVVSTVSSALSRRVASLKNSPVNNASSQKPLQSKGLGSRISTKSAPNQECRSLISPASRQTGESRSVPQSIIKAETLNTCQRPSPVKTNRVFSAIFGKNAQLSRFSSSVSASKSQGSLMGMHLASSLGRNQKKPPAKAGKNMETKDSDEAKKEVRSFLRKGSGWRSSIDNIQKQKSIGACMEKAVRAPLFSSHAHTSRPELRPRIKPQSSKKDDAMGISPISKSSDSSENPDMKGGSRKAALLSKSEVLAHERNASGPLSTHRKTRFQAPVIHDAREVLTLFTSNTSTACRELENNHANPKGTLEVF